LNEQRKKQMKRKNHNLAWKKKDKQRKKKALQGQTSGPKSKCIEFCGQQPDIRLSGHPELSLFPNISGLP
jgi:hypothetical protein